MKLSKRLKEVAQHVRRNELLVDIGSDHAYLPIYLVQNNFVPTAIAGEVVPGPFNHALEKVTEYNLEDKISVRMGDGLSILSDQDIVGTITICGMGGLLIRDILNYGRINQLLSNDSRLILQPNNGEKELRIFLIENHYEIIAEEIVEENNKMYEIIVAEKTNNKVEYTTDDLIFGPKLLQEKNTFFIKKWQRELDKHKSILEQIKQSNNYYKVQMIEEKVQQIERVLT